MSFSKKVEELETSLKKSQKVQEKVEDELCEMRLEHLTLANEYVKLSV